MFKFLIRLKHWIKMPFQHENKSVENYIMKHTIIYTYMFAHPRARVCVWVCYPVSHIYLVMMDQLYLQLCSRELSIPFRRFGVKRAKTSRVLYGTDQTREWVVFYMFSYRSISCGLKKLCLFSSIYAWIIRMNTAPFCG